MRTVIIKAKPLSRFHFGKSAIDNKTGLADTSDWMSSDALFSALVNNVAKYKANKTNEFIKLFEDTKVRISSLFYCLSNEMKIIYFLPKPVNASTKLPEDSQYLVIKKVKKIRFLSQAVLETYGEDWVKQMDNLTTIGNAMLLKEELPGNINKEIDGLYKKGFATNINSRPKPLKDEETGETKIPQNELFQTDYIQLPLYENWKTHFYFLVEDEKLNEEERKLLNFAIDLVRFEGLGGKRNVGYGWIDQIDKNQTSPFTWVPGTESLKSITTGLFIPQNLEEFNRLQAYELVQKGGRKIDKTTTLKVVNMITEGALLKGTEMPKGKMADISPDENNSTYFRLGICITLPLKHTEA
ncbi:MAG: type III-A CRISPR-associated RAMP protein Csm4 [Peptostreptococcaceae bacterium]|nr:type III-A CRISPR-associated RAMP protein Csm4 [Peptostreptococcaceae bacterium]